MRPLLIESMNLVGAVQLRMRSSMAKYLTVIVNYNNQNMKLLVALLIELIMSCLWTLDVKNVKV
jgi:hypothetical protein|nr:MAG TPA: hypothetical protein [Caudoviricetes sp.]